MSQVMTKLMPKSLKTAVQKCSEKTLLRVITFWLNFDLQKWPQSAHFASKNGTFYMLSPQRGPKRSPRELQGPPGASFWSLLVLIWWPQGSILNLFQNKKLQVKLHCKFAFQTLMALATHTPSSTKTQWNKNFQPQRINHKRGGRRCVAVGVFDI